MKENFEFPKRWQTILLGCMGVGLLLFLIGVFMGTPVQRVYTALMYNSVFFVGIGLIGMFFISVHELGFGGWLIGFKRVLEAMMMFVPFGAVILLAVLVLGNHDIYHWTHDYLYDVDSPKYDALVASKKAFLNVPGFLTRSIIYLVGWSVLIWLFRRNSLNYDENPGIDGYKKGMRWAAIFIVFFAVTSSMASWDWLMSINPHWYSTLYGWYCFASLFVSGLCMLVILINILKNAGYLERVNEEHLHDIGKFIFGFSIFWTYLWFSQFMLIWYSNIPEETLYFHQRFEGGYKFVFFLVLLINFPLPFLFLMKAGFKRNRSRLLWVACVVLIGHWLDFYTLSMPGALEHGENGVIPGGMSIFMEIAIFTFFVGLFGFIFFKTLAKAPIYQVNHPFIQESLNHHTQ